MLKSILLVFAGAVLIAAPFAVAGRGARQAEATPAAAADSGAASSGVPADTVNPVVVPAPNAPAKVRQLYADQQAKAKQLYSIDCSMCHGDNGNGKTDLATSMGVAMPDFTDAKTLAGAKDGELFNQIRNGKGKMPGEEKGRASDMVVWNLVLYVRNFSAPQSAALPAK